MENNLLSMLLNFRVISSLCKFSNKVKYSNEKFGHEGCFVILLNEYTVPVVLLSEDEKHLRFIQ